MVLKVFPKGDFLGLLICCSQKNSDQVTLKIPFVAISFKSNLRMTGLEEQTKARLRVRRGKDRATRRTPQTTQEALYNFLLDITFLMTLFSLL